MKNFYTIIKISPNTTVGDTVSIGLLAVSESGIWFKISDEKKKIVKMLLARPETAEFVVNQLENSIKELSKSPKRGISLASAEYLKHLSISFNGLLQFSAPSEISEELNDDRFNKLFSLLIDGK